MPRKTATILEIPELAGLDARRGLIRIPPDFDVPLSDRVRRLIDTADFRRLARISQVGLVSLVYPAALHTRFEHSLGVYRLALLLLKRLAYEERFAELIRPEDAELFIVAALLHDIGHWPFCHPIEDMHLPGIPSHEKAAKSFILEGEIADVLRSEWKVDPRHVLALLNKASIAPGTLLTDADIFKLLISILSGPIDIDKMDYLYRDSLHAGVPYGRNFDQNRLIGSLCLNEAGNGLAITEKGKTAAELMVFARYVMFSEVYWHHGVRSATAMFQRAFYMLRESVDLSRLFRTTELEFIEILTKISTGSASARLLDGLFGSRRRLLKRVGQYGHLEHPEIYRKFAGRPYPWLCEQAERLQKNLKIDGPVLVDAPPVAREVEIKIDVYYPKEKRYSPLDLVSPVVRTLAREQFDDHVKKVRIFIPKENLGSSCTPEKIAAELRKIS